jgi:hypothetical protein
MSGDDALEAPFDAAYGRLFRAIQDPDDMVTEETVVDTHRLRFDYRMSSEAGSEAPSPSNKNKGKFR